MFEWLFSTIYRSITWYSTYHESSSVYGKTIISKFRALIFHYKNEFFNPGNYRVWTIFDISHKLRFASFIETIMKQKCWYNVEEYIFLKHKLQHKTS